MGVYINMEMPTHCMDCPFMVSRDNDDCILQSAEANENFENWEQMKAGCPLVPVPPHGRLIDASESIRVELYDEEHEDWTWHDMTIDDLLSQSWVDADAPTIIPADPAAEGE